MFWYILIALITVTVLWILLGPVIIFVNTDNNSYSLALPGIFRASVQSSPDLFLIRGSVFFIPYRFRPFGRKHKSKEGKAEKAPRKKRAFKAGEGLSLARNMLHTFRIRKLHMNIDTDDFTLNAQLIPVFSAVNSDKIRLQANFEGRTSLLMDLRTRLGAIVWAFLKTKYKSKFNQ